MTPGIFDKIIRNITNRKNKFKFKFTGQYGHLMQNKVTASGPTFNGRKNVLNGMIVKLYTKKRQ